MAINIKITSSTLTSKKHIFFSEFVKEAGRGGKGNLPLANTPTITQTEPWDGKDGEVIEEDEFSLEELMGDESVKKDEL